MHLLAEKGRFRDPGSAKHGCFSTDWLCPVKLSEPFLAQGLKFREELESGSASYRQAASGANDTSTCGCKVPKVAVRLTGAWIEVQAGHGSNRLWIRLDISILGVQSRHLESSGSGRWRLIGCRVTGEGSGGLISCH